jgi:hypothetical protein
MRLLAKLLILTALLASYGAAKAAPDYAALTKIPAKEGLNPGLTRALPATLAAALGVPDMHGMDAAKCYNARATAALQRRLVKADVGPFTVTGHSAAVASLKRIFAAVRREHPELYAQVKTAGMLCIRLRRQINADGTTSSGKELSNHSYGTAIDLYFGKGADFKRDGKCAGGLLALYPYFLKEGWFWGAAIPGNEDPMHFELAEETLEALEKAGKL